MMASLLMGNKLVSEHSVTHSVKNTQVNMLMEFDKVMERISGLVAIDIRGSGKRI